VIPIRLPALRERRDDIPILVQHFLDHFNQELRKNTFEVEPAALERMTAYNWPGNIRELRNIIERIMILETKDRIEMSDLPGGLQEGDSEEGSFVASAGVRAPAPVGAMTLEEMERKAISDALDRAGNNQVRAAKLLGISRDTLRYRLKKFGLLESSRNP
jgi:DNA-binding NtrC family response regulator